MDVLASELKVHKDVQTAIHDVVVVNDGVILNIQFSLFLTLGMN